MERAKRFCPYCMSPVEEGKPCGACGLTQGSYTPSPHHLPPGTVLKDRYLVGRVLGEGGFGITYIGCDLQLEMKVAIKEYFPTDKASRQSQASLDVASYTGAAGVNYDKGLEKFHQEARTIGRLNKQPVIVNVQDFIEANHTAYIVMEYVEGTTFKELTEQRGGRIPAGELLHLIEPLFFALKEMHSIGLIHRDISPENLMLEKGEVRLLDFGCAREAANGEATMTIALKHGYAPVEQYQSSGQGAWTDVYALSATIYYCLTGRKPPQAMDRMLQPDELVPPRKLGVELTQQQEQALLRGMGVRPKQRFQSMEEFHAALYEGFVPKPVPDPEPEPEPGPGPRPDPKPVRFDLLEWLKQNKLMAGGIAAALALVVLMAAVLPRILGPSAVPDPDPVQTVGPPAGPEVPAEDPDQPVSKPLVFSQGNSQEENAAALLAQLAEDGRDTVTIPAGVRFDVYEPVTLNKTLRVSPSGGVYFNAPLVVGEGGHLEAQGEVSANATLRALDGGTIAVGPGGYLGTHLLWLEREEDLSCDPEGRVNVWGDDNNPTRDVLDEWALSHYLVLDEEAFFADAVHVATEEEFTARCQGNTPIVVDGEITMTEYHFATAPILVSEGAMLNAPCDEHGDFTLDVCSILINHGELQGRVSLINFTGEERVGRFINYGHSSAALNAFMVSIVINLGQIDICYGEIKDTVLSNLGTLSVFDEVSVEGNWSNNAGTIAVNGQLLFGAGTGWVNCGEILVEDGGTLSNAGRIDNQGGTIQAAPGGSVDNSGIITLEAGALRVAEGAALNNSGVITDGMDRLELASGSVSTGDGHIVPFAWNNDWSKLGGAVRWVETEASLRAALEDPSVVLVIWNGPEEAVLEEGTLTVNKGLAFPSGEAARLSVQSGGIAVTGEDAFLYCDCALDLADGELRVSGGTAVLNSGDIRCGGVSVTDGGVVFPAELPRD